MSSWFEQLDLGSLQRDLAKSVEEATGIINNVNNLDILNFDAMAEQEEADNLAAEADEESEEEEEIEPAPVVSMTAPTTIPVEAFETESARKLSFIESQKAIQSKMKENAKSVVRKLNYTPDDDFVDGASPTTADGSTAHKIKVIQESPNRKFPPSSAEAKNRKEDVLSAYGSEEGELVEISLNSVENTPMKKGLQDDRVNSTSVEDESEDNFGGVRQMEHPPAGHSLQHVSGSMTDDSSHSSYLSGGSKHGAFTDVATKPVITLSKKATKKLARQQRQQNVETSIVDAVDESRPSLYRSEETVTKGIAALPAAAATATPKETKQKTKKAKTKAPKNLDFWGVSSTKKTLNFPKSSVVAASSSHPAVPATPGALNNTVPPETPGGGFENYGGAVRFTDDVTTPEKTMTSSTGRNNISIGLLSDDTYGSDDLFQDHTYSSSSSGAAAEGGGSSSLSAISNTTSTLINNFLASRLVASVTAPSSSSSRSASGAASEVNPQSLFTFFDNVDEEVDLESDPILKRVKQNQANPNFQRETMAETASAVLARLYQGAAQTYSGRVSSNTSSSGGGGGGGVGGGAAAGNDVINNPTIFQIISTLMGQNPITGGNSTGRSPANASTSPVTPRTEQRQQQQAMTRALPLRVMIGNYIKMSLLYIWDNMFSTNGITVITAILFIYSYFKFQRYGTDAGDR